MSLRNCQNCVTKEASQVINALILLKEMASGASSKEKSDDFWEISVYFLFVLKFISQNWKFPWQNSKNENYELILSKFVGSTLNYLNEIKMWLIKMRKT